MVPQKEYTFTYKNISERKKKNLSILDCVRRKTEVSRTDISKETGINIVSVSNYITNYIKKSLVWECGRDISTGGRRPELVRLNLESAYVAGLDIGPEKLVAVITDLGLKTKAKLAMPRPAGAMDAVMDASLELLDKLFKDFGQPIENIKLIGIGASGVVDIFSGTVHDTDPARGKTKTNLFNLARRIEEKFNVESLVGNDATCAAFGELSLNPDTELSEMLYIYSDIGCGIIINRDVYCGASGSAGEVQLAIGSEDSKKIGAAMMASYGVKGIDLGIVKKAKELLEKGGSKKILELVSNKKDEITKETIFKAAEEGDKFAKELLIDAAYWLAVKIAYLVNIFNPQLVVIGGGMEKAGNLFMDTISTSVKIYAFEEAFSAAKILPSFLGEDAVAIGAASLGIRELFLNA